MPNKDLTIQHIPFSVIREDFCECKVENGQILRMKSVVMDIFNEEKNEKVGSGINFNQVSHVITTVNIDTSELQFAEATNVTEKDQVTELSFVTTKQIVNIYETDKSVILVTPDVEKIFLTNKKDKTNSPILRYISRTSVNVVQKPTFSES
jgi:hypothetical protein